MSTRSYKACFNNLRRKLKKEKTNCIIWQQVHHRNRLFVMVAAKIGKIMATTGFWTKKKYYKTIFYLKK